MFATVNKRLKSFEAGIYPMLILPVKYIFNHQVDVIVSTSNIREPFLRDPMHTVEVSELSPGGKACGGISCVMHYLPAPGH